MEIDRTDGRTPNQLRPLACSRNVLNRAHGSASWTQGDTKVLVAVYGPKAGAKKNENSEKASIEVIWKPKTGQIEKLLLSYPEAVVGTQAWFVLFLKIHSEGEIHEWYNISRKVSGKLEKEYEMILKRTLQSICILTMNPNTTTSVIVQVVNDDGALLPCAANAACAALLDAGIPMKHLSVAISCCVVDGGHVILDPTKQEEEKMKAVVYLVFPNSALSVLPKGSSPMDGEPFEHGIITSVTHGLMSVDDYLYCLERGRAATTKMSSFLRRSLQSQLPTDLADAA